MLLLFAEGGTKNMSVVHKFEIVMNWRSPYNYPGGFYNWQVQEKVAHHHHDTIYKTLKILKNIVNKHFITQVWQIYLALCYKQTCFNILSNRERRPVFLPTLVCSHNSALSSSEEVFCFLFFFLCWTLCDMVSCFREGAVPSSTNTGLAPNSRRHDVRKKRFLESVLLLEKKYVGVSCIQ